jgi:ATP-binding cassette subfamily B protein
MDCGPAALAAVLGGFGIRASYARLREACHTDIDGTSIDALEDIAVLLGLDASQTMAPANFVAVPAAGNLPAIVVARLPNGFTHFVVAWRRVGRYVEVMDPAIGRRWVRADRFERDLFVHTFAIPRDLWDSWSRSEDLLEPLRLSMCALGLDRNAADALVSEASAADSTDAVAALDAATRLCRAIASARRPDSPRALIESLARDPNRIPAGYWFARPTDDGTVELRGAVLVRVAGPADATPSDESLSPDVAAVLDAAAPRPNAEVLGRLTRGGWFAPSLLVVGLVLAGLGTLAEALLFRNVIDNPVAGIPGGLIAVAAVLLVIEASVAAGGVALARHAEHRLRRELFTTLPLLSDAYVRSRPHSDMAERAHRIHQFRLLPQVGALVVRSAVELVAIVIGLCVLVPSRAALVVVAGAAALAVPVAAVPPLAERDLRMRTHGGALARFFLDALLGLIPLRAHAAESTVRGEHTRLLEEWADAGRAVFRTAAIADAIQSVVGVVLAIVLVATLPDDARDPGTILLVAYLAVTIPVLGQTLMLALRQYPLIRNTTRRFLEPLGAGQPMPLDNDVVTDVSDLRVEGVTVVAAGHVVLDEIELTIDAGEHVAIVGRSGAGKSTLASLLMGLVAPAKGTVTVGGHQLSGATIESFRRRLAWIGPDVQLWNASLIDNVRYGNATASPDAVAEAVRLADLESVAARFTDSSSVIGESGGLLSGGEGQRVRAARALARRDAQFVVLDEPFRGLDRSTRTRLLERVRTNRRDATLLCITHDVHDTIAFPRVVVIEDGRVVEDGDPRALSDRLDGRYRALLDAERASEAALREPWVTWTLADGRLR